jgi:hypothetical protein
MAMLRHCLDEGARLDLGVDMTMGTGWCFGGPDIRAEEASAAVVVHHMPLAAGQKLTATFDRAATQALMAFDAAGKSVDLRPLLAADGTVDWTAPPGAWTVWQVSEKPAGNVKRAAPGGDGYMLDPFGRGGVTRFLARFTRVFDAWDGPKPRAMYQDSFEYPGNWSPELFEAFVARRGYRLQDHLPQLFSEHAGDTMARVKADYRETVSDQMIEAFAPLWTGWCRARGIKSRFQAHGSPGNWLDLYAAADMPETEMFHTDRDPLVSKFASSAGHVTGKPLICSETGTWLAEHFTETLDGLKQLLDDLWLGGINHVVYHGTCYSPDDAPWPGWVFYAATQMNPRNAFWHDVPALNACIARVQTVLQDGASDNDFLLYWPIHDLWHDDKGLAMNLTVHNARTWFDGQPFGVLAHRLWDRGFSFDYVSDRQLAAAQAAEGGIATDGGRYALVLVPPCHRLPLPTADRLLALAEGGATVVFSDQLPDDVPGLADLDTRRAALRQRWARLTFHGDAVRQAVIGRGKVLVGPPEAALAALGVPRESLADHPGLRFVRRARGGGHDYLLVNRGDTPLDDWLQLAKPAPGATLTDPANGVTGAAARRDGAIRVQLPPHGSLLLATQPATDAAPWPYLDPAGPPRRLTGTWQVTFLSGGPELPPLLTLEKLGTWTAAGGEAERFAGTARYALDFTAPEPAGAWLLDLGTVCHSARLRLDGREIATLFAAPFQWRLAALAPGAHRLEVDVTNLSANRIRDLDRRGVKWHDFHDIDFVNIDYRPFDASRWPVRDSGLLGPVTLTPLR